MVNPVDEEVRKELLDNAAHWDGLAQDAERAAADDVSDLPEAPDAPAAVEGEAAVCSVGGKTFNAHRWDACCLRCMKNLDVDALLREDKILRDCLTVDGALLQAKLEVAHASGYAEGLEAALAVCVAREDLRAAKTRLRELIKRARVRSPKE